MTHVFSYLPPKDVAAAAETQKSWRGVSHEPTLWQAQAKDTFEHNPAPARAFADARADFEARWVDSRALCAKLIQGLSRPAARGAADLASQTNLMARPHRLEVAHYILKRTELRMQLRLSSSDVKAAIERAVACVAPADKPEIEKRGLELEKLFEKRVLKYRC